MANFAFFISFMKFYKYLGGLINLNLAQQCTFTCPTAYVCEKGLLFSYAAVVDGAEASGGLGIA